MNETEFNLLDEPWIRVMDDNCQIKEVSLTFYGEDSFTKNTEKLYGIEADKLSDGGILYSSDGNYADEISMLKMADGSSAKSQLSDRLSYRLNQYENYKPEETKKIQAAKIFQAGDYWVLVISDNADEISDEITDMIN